MVVGTQKMVISSLENRSLKTQKSSPEFVSPHFVDVFTSRYTM